jgi:hypothetical protein
VEEWLLSGIQVLNVQGAGGVRQTEIHTAEPSTDEVEITIRKLKRYKAQGSDHIPAELIQAGGGNTAFWDAQTFYADLEQRRIAHQWKESIVIPIHKRGDKTDCSNYRGISLLSASYKIVSNILLSRLIPYADEIVGDYQCGFWRKKSMTDQIFYIRQVLEKNGSIMAQYISYIRFQESLWFC